MTTFLIMVTGSPASSQNAYTAFRFCTAAVQAGHCIEQVFFYGEGVHNASAVLAAHPSDFTAAHSWNTLSIAHKFPLNVCVTAAAKRGLLSDEDALEQGLPTGQTYAAFNMVGMAEYFAALQSKNVTLVQF